MTRRLTVDLPDELYAVIEALAAEAGMEPGEFVRTVLQRSDELVRVRAELLRRGKAQELIDELLRGDGRDPY